MIKCCFFLYKLNVPLMAKVKWSRQFWIICEGLPHALPCPCCPPTKPIPCMLCSLSTYTMPWQSPPPTSTTSIQFYQGWAHWNHRTVLMLSNSVKESWFCPLKGLWSHCSSRRTLRLVRPLMKMPKHVRHVANKLPTGLTRNSSLFIPNVLIL